ncbi:MAG: hypothetical protein WCC95_11710 [Candidatus Sulfotelmatobacter sp.]
MRFLCIFGLVLACLSSSGANPGPKDSTDSKRRDTPTVGAEHLARAADFERSGLLPEAQAEYLAALQNKDAAVHDKALSGLLNLQNQRLNRASRTAELYMSLGRGFEQSSEWDQAIANYEKALQVEDWDGREEAARSVATAAIAKESAYQKYGPGWIYPIGIKVILCIGVGAAVLGILLSVRMATSAVSKRIEVREFQDPAQTGLGSTFPALIRERLLSSLALTRPGFAFLRGEDRRAPVVVSRAGVQLPNVEISWSAFKIADALGALRRLIVVPRYILDGSVSKQENQVRIGVEMIRHGELVQAWSFDSSQDFGDCAYQVSYAVLREYA